LSTLVMADGFSCKEQIQQHTGRHGLHLAEVMQIALHNGNGAPQMYPEAELVTKRKAAQRRSMKRAGLVTGILAAAGALLWFARRRA